MIKVLSFNATTTYDTMTNAIAEFNNILGDYAHITVISTGSSTVKAKFSVGDNSYDINLRMAYSRHSCFVYDDVRNIIALFEINSSYKDMNGTNTIFIKDGALLVSASGIPNNITGLKKVNVNVRFPRNCMCEMIFVDKELKYDDVLVHLVSGDSSQPTYTQGSIYRNVYQYNGKRYIGVADDWAIQSDEGNETFIEM